MHEEEIKYTPQYQKEDPNDDTAHTSNLNILEKSDNLRTFQTKPSVQLPSSCTKICTKESLNSNPKYICLPEKHLPKVWHSSEAKPIS